jgi:hypothetical protein
MYLPRLLLDFSQIFVHMNFFYSEMNLCIATAGSVRLPVCMSVTFLDHVQTDHRRNPILCIDAHLYT